MKSSNSGKSLRDDKKMVEIPEDIFEENTKAWMHRMIKEEREYVKNLKVIKEVILKFKLKMIFE